MPKYAQTKTDNRVIVIGAGLGGLSAAMRLGAKGYAVTVLDKLDRTGDAARPSRRTDIDLILDQP